jgi:ribonuclease P protein component
MLSLPNRLPKNDIPLLLRRGMHVRNDYIELVYKKRQIPSTGADDNKNSRFAFIVSTKIDKRATARNRMRRTMSESVRHVMETTPPIDGIFIAKKNFAELAQAEVEQIVISFLRL